MKKSSVGSTKIRPQYCRRFMSEPLPFTPTKLSSFQIGHAPWEKKRARHCLLPGPNTFRLLLLRVSLRARENSRHRGLRIGQYLVDVLVAGHDAVTRPHQRIVHFKKASNTWMIGAGSHFTQEDRHYLIV